MREKKSIKRAFALLLAAVLAFTTFSSDLTAIAADTTPASSKTSVSATTKDGIKLEKSAVLNSDGTVDISFKVDGNNAVQYVNQAANTDIILVLDTSSSMNSRTKLGNAMKAAKDFVTNVFKTDGVRPDRSS